MIKRLKVTNFKIHKETEIFFSGFLSILTGENNSGKTSLLEAMMIFSECYAHSLRKIQRSSNNKAKSGTLTVGQYDFKPSEFISYFSSVRSENYYELFYKGESSFQIEADFKLDDTEFTLAFEVKQGRNQTAYNIENRTTEAHLQRFNQINPENLLDVIKSVPVASVMRNEPYMPPKMLAKQLSENAQISTLRNRLLLIASAHKLTELQYQLSFIMGFAVFELRVSFNPNDDLYIQAEFRTDTQADYQDIAMLGSGTLQMLEVLVSLNLASKSACRVVLLDEPDSFLHRRLQQNLMSKLRDIANQGIQIIATTHNEQIISTAQLNELYHLADPRNPQLVRTISAELPKGRIKGLISPTAKSTLYDALGVSASAMNILEAIEADRLVLVEGRTDALYVQALQARRQLLFPVQQPKKVAFWAINGVSELGSKLKYWKDVFSAIKNGQSLWDKAILLLDSDSLDEVEMSEVSQRLKEMFDIEAIFLKSYTLESSLLLDMSRFIMALSKAFELESAFVETLMLEWRDKITLDARLDRIEKQRQARVKDYHPLNSTQLAGLCHGNQYNAFVTALRQDPQQVARLADKTDVFELVRAVSSASERVELQTLSDEALLLTMIEQIDASTWPSDWQPILKKIYG